MRGVPRLCPWTLHLGCEEAPFPFPVLVVLVCKPRTVTAIILPFLLLNRAKLRLGSPQLQAGQAFQGKVGGGGTSTQRRRRLPPPVTWPGRWRQDRLCLCYFKVPLFCPHSGSGRCELWLAPQQSLSLVRHSESLLWEQKVR